MLDSMVLKVLHRCDPERAAYIAKCLLKLGTHRLYSDFKSPRLNCSIAGILLENPLGLAAGFDKHAHIIKPLSKISFGFLEIGTVTPKAQKGNPRPRLFRLTQDKAAINRFGFNSQGVDRIIKRLKKRPPKTIIGLNLGANKDSQDRVADYLEVLEKTTPYIDYATINVSSPNTPNLRAFQKSENLKPLLERILEHRKIHAPNLPIFVKISPDLEPTHIDEMSKIFLDAEIDGIIATNTTTTRPKTLRSPHKKQSGGLSGKPLFELSTRILAHFYLATEGKIPLIGVGGISSAKDAEIKIKAGASALQIYTALAFQGLGLVQEILKELDKRMEEENATIEKWCGSKASYYAKPSAKLRRECHILEEENLTEKSNYVVV